MQEPLCFVLMPFGNKKDENNKEFKFDEIYNSVIEPAIANAELESLRADEEMGGGIIHKPMLERLILCEFAIADLTTANANVFYELGLRHAVRPWSTVLIFAKGTRLPFDVEELRALPYEVDSDGKPINISTTIDALTTKLKYAKKESREHEMGGFTDSPLYQLVEDYPQIDHTKTDVFRERVAYSKQKKKDLKDARKKETVSKAERIKIIKEIEANAGDIANLESGLLIDFLLSYRALSAWDEMVRLVLEMPKFLAGTILVQEQYAFALNRLGRGEEAEEVLKEVLNKRGPSSETLGLLGRIYKDRWQTAKKNGETVLANALLGKAVETYLQGFEADWRDAYPGINALTLMSLQEERDSRFDKIIPVVKYSVERRLETKEADYWDYATMVELAILDRDKQQAGKYLGKALVLIREKWEPETTARNIRMILEGSTDDREYSDWVSQIESVLQQYSN
ncbi:DUF4071 domain-containing protein [Spirosoma taeanense]|uniref:DUF4071 domain-containing protein n=1 Tax=Spirosoma taeanense TaxID=2735870 RepID=A0A6M5Y3U5_9BACT|nr:TRAFs-binding domain-containing protein [Spirosoma taeanense]QJW89227.1 DUF4071 domain-containing protein [Spirosoma taeanense]